MYRRLGEAQGRSGQVRKISPPPGFDHRTVQPLIPTTLPGPHYVSLNVKIIYLITIIVIFKTFSVPASCAKYSDV